MLDAAPRRLALRHRQWPHLADDRRGKPDRRGTQPARPAAASARRAEARFWADDAHVHPGERIVTRDNNRRLQAGHNWVKNGDIWTITDIHPDGSVRAVRDDDRAQVTLPPDYVRSTSTSATPPPPTAPKAEPWTPPTP